MGNPKANFSAIENVKIKIKEHPICAYFEDEEWSFTVIYPQGSFSVAGVRVRYEKGKRRALENLLQKMEYHWQERFPGDIR